MALLESAFVLLVGGVLLLAGLPILYLFVLTLTSFRLDRKQPESGIPAKRIAVVIPARNEGLLIADTVSNVLQQHYPRESFTILVVADNCDDDTAEQARSSGARVHERTTDPGKGQALREALALLLDEEWDAFLMMDADSHLHPEALASLNRAIAAGNQAIQLRLGVLNPRSSIRNLTMELSTASFNALRPRGRAALGWSGRLHNNGFCLTRALIENIPFPSDSIVANVEYHIRLLQAGYHVAFLDRAWVKTQFPLGGRGAEIQRIRWERGRIQTIRRHAPTLLREALKGNAFALGELLDVLMPPVSLIVLLLLLPLVFGTPLQFRLAALLAVTLYLHYLIAAWRYASLAGLLRLTLYIPWYILWKTYVVGRSLFTERNLPWARTNR
jgi:cellulose synthase/poly-beta-1,6-N-acetylglucosamine synthase-like glycosyltransferase